MKKYKYIIVIVLVIALIGVTIVNASQDTSIAINPVYGEQQYLIDENIYYAMDNTLSKINIIYKTGDDDKLTEYINPCMAFALAWSDKTVFYDNISYTGVVDFNPDSYNFVPDWVTISRNIGCVNYDWYYANIDNNKLSDGKCKGMPELFYNDGCYSVYGINSGDYSEYTVNDRVCPTIGFMRFMQYIKTYWTNNKVNPISDITVMAKLYCCRIKNMDGISIVNTTDFQNKIVDIASKMYSSFEYEYMINGMSINELIFDEYVTEAASSYDVPQEMIIILLKYLFYKQYYISGR